MPPVRHLNSRIDRKWSLKRAWSIVSAKRALPSGCGVNATWPMTNVLPSRACSVTLRVPSGAGRLSAALAPSLAGEPRAWAVAGMAGLFAATVRAPLTGIVLMLEMTDSYSLMLPLLAASFAGQWTADLLGEPPVYDSLLERELAASSEIERPEGALLLELDVLPDAPFAGRRVSELGLPRGVLIVALERRDTNHVVTGTTRLAAGDRLTVIVSPEVADSVGSLRVGLGMEESG